MSYNTILVNVDDSPNAEQRIKLALSMAETAGCHAIGAAASGLSRYILPQVMDSADPSVAQYLNNALAQAKQGARTALSNFERRAMAMGLSFETQLVEDDAYGAFSLLARYSDLAVLGQSNRYDPKSVSTQNLAEFVAINSGRPILMVPYTGEFAEVGKRILVAWDGSISATRAIASALPLLKTATLVQVVIFNANAKPKTHGQEPGADIALYLARHGVTVEVLQKETKVDVGIALLDLAVAQSCDLIVMGCYGHTRFREILLGGATRTMLEKSTLPVLMSH